jgi:hypothetical protein
MPRAERREHGALQGSLSGMNADSKAHTRRTRPLDRRPDQPGLPDALTNWSGSPTAAEHGRVRTGAANAPPALRPRRATSQDPDDPPAYSSGLPRPFSVTRLGFVLARQRAAETPETTARVPHVRGNGREFPLCLSAPPARSSHYDALPTTTQFALRPNPHLSRVGH